MTDTPSNVIPAGIVTSLDVPVDQVLEAAHEKNLETIVIMGWTQSGGSYFASSKSDGAEVNWLIDVIKQELVSGGYEQ